MVWQALGLDSLAGSDVQRDRCGHLKDRYQLGEAYLSDGARRGSEFAEQACRAIDRESDFKVLMSESPNGIPFTSGLHEAKWFATALIVRAKWFHGRDDGGRLTSISRSATLRLLWDWGPEPLRKSHLTVF